MNAGVHVCVGGWGGVYVRARASLPLCVRVCAYVSVCQCVRPSVTLSVWVCVCVWLSEVVLIGKFSLSATCLSYHACGDIVFILF